MLNNFIMKNYLTRAEVFEMFGDVELTLEKYIFKRFVFSGADKDNNHVIVNIASHAMLMVENNAVIVLSDYESNFTTDSLNLLIIDADSTILYED